MDDLLTAVNTVRPVSNEEAKTQPTLTAIKTSISRSVQDVTRPSVQNAAPPKVSALSGITTDSPQSAKTAEEALRVLRSQPDTETLLPTLDQLVSRDGFAGFSLAAPGPIQAHIVNTILSDIIPTFWPTLESSDRTLVVRCLHNVTGINALLARLRALSTSGGAIKRLEDNGHSSLSFSLEVANQLFQHNTLARDLHTGLRDAVSGQVRRDLAWKEFVNLLGSGKIVSIVAQAEDAARQTEKLGTPSTASWLAKGIEYAAWLGRNIAALLICWDDGQSQDTATTQGGQLLAKAFSVGYPSALLEGLISELLALKEEVLQILMPQMPGYAKKQLLEQFLRWLSGLCPSTDLTHETGTSHADRDVPALAALLIALIDSDSATCCQHIRIILGDPALSTSLSHPVRRACITVLADLASDDLETLLETLMTTFSDRLFIDHAPVLHQECIAQTLLLTAGHLHRESPMAVLMIARSSGHMQGTSNRLDASGQRARWLGMVVATAVSSLVDREGAKMDFGVDEVKTKEAMWHLGLTRVNDRVGRVSDFRALLARQETTIKPARKRRPIESGTLPALNGKPVFGPPRPPPTPAPAQTEVISDRITELLDDTTSDEDNDLKPYAKPDSDPEDSDEDATLVNRKKPRPPVYIRDLMSMLRDDKTPDRFQLGMTHAAALIRRKADFGGEVKDHAEEMIGLLCNLQDPFNTEQFDELRLQAMIAVLLSHVQMMGPWLSKHVFVEGYSIAQRCVMLSALGLGGRELAGLGGQDELNPVLSNTEFPSKRLPARLHATYTAGASMSAKRLDTASKKLEDQLIQPLALRAADESTSHLNAVKVRTFSSRMAVERTKRKPAPNKLAKVFAQSIFFPLVNRYQQDLAAYGSGSVFASASVALVTFIKTLALLFHACGEAIVGVAELTAEFWDLLLSLRVRAARDIVILEAVLFSMLTLLEVNTDKRRLAYGEGKRLMETRQWVGVVFERAGGGEMVGGGGSREEERVRRLAAGVLVRTGELAETYEREIFGRIGE